MKKLFVISVITLLGFFGCHDNIFSPDTISKSITRNDSTFVNLKYGETVLINDELEIGFVGVPADSRCPINAMCVWAGDGEVKLTLKKGNSLQSLSLHTTLDPKVFVFDNYEIQLVNLQPSRVAGEQLKQEQYSIELKIKSFNTLSTKPVYFIDGNSEWLIRKDFLTVNEVSLENDILSLSVSYSGGCRDHMIDLFAYTGIAKSIPPQMSLVVSHEGHGDMCEAYVTNKIKYDLRKLRGYLAGYDKVLLNISGPDGKLIKQSPLVYILK